MSQTKEDSRLERQMAAKRKKKIIAAIQYHYIDFIVPYILDDFFFREVTGGDFASGADFMASRNPSGKLCKCI